MPAIAFDIDDTLYDLAWPFWRACDSFFGGDLGLPRDELFRLLRLHSDEAYELVLAGEKPTEYMHVYRVQKAFGDFGVEVSREDALAFQREYERFQGQISMTDDVRSMLAACARSSWRTGVITNGDSEHQWNKVDTLGVCTYVPCEHIVVSGDIGFRKPQVGAFRAAEERFGVPPEEAWFVGDTYETDVMGALGAGWRCLWIDRRGRGLAEGERMPDAVVCTEGEMVDFVREMVLHGA